MSDMECPIGLKGQCGLIKKAKARIKNLETALAFERGEKVIETFAIKDEGKKSCKAQKCPNPVGLCEKCEWWKA